MHKSFIFALLIKYTWLLILIFETCVCRQCRKNSTIKNEL
jgi:hypothetical protein